MSLEESIQKVVLDYNIVIDVVGRNIKIFEGEITLNIKEMIDGGYPSILCCKDVILNPDDC